ncbi:MAG: hypothetical protein PUH29_02620 [Lachnospiraceae bacterium]|nr:hypothetical protein [Lachnospiraceae bacterium]MDY5496590.1 hypothetical protein [Anaerobutyricum sp.]
MSKKEIPVMNVGISLIILMIMSICLAAFSVLSLENAMADDSLSQKTADHTTAYYKAVNQVQKQLKDTDRKLEEIWAQTGTKEGRNRQKEYETRVKTVFCKAGVSEENREITWFLTQKVSSRQTLTVRLSLENPETGRFYRILSWQLKPDGVWQADRSLNVYREKEGGGQ